MTQKAPGSSVALSAAACPPGALPGGPTRTRFFDGMFLTQADLENEQLFWRLKRRLTNRALGEGVVWGLSVEWNQRTRSFRLAPGYALDCCGNDLVVECPVEISERELWGRAEGDLRPGQAGKVPYPAPSDNTAGAAAERAAAERVQHACLVLQYVECPEEARPVHRDACAGPAGYCEPSRIRESTRLSLAPPPKQPPKTPPELFVQELEQWRDSLPADVRALLFPNPGPPPASAAATGAVPLELRVSVPGTPGQSTNVQLPATGSAGPFASLQSQQASGAATGVVTFELLAGTGFSLSAGRVSDRGRPVETVTPPAAPSMYWALDLAPPTAGATAATSFEFVLEDVELTQTFGSARRGRVRAIIRGRASVVPAAPGMSVRVDGLTVVTERADVFGSAERPRCLSELLPWGWAVNPDNGSKIARVLVLGALYAFLSELVRGTSSAVTREVARIVYSVVWYALFGVNPAAAVDEAHRRRLVEHILALYRRWCTGLMYPGPRCTDDHHGVYLGCVELSRSGAITSFDPWANRRYVLTGPLLEHWARQLGFAPLDVIVARFARALCCLGGLPPVLTEGSADGRFPWIGSTVNTVHMGTPGSVADFAGAQGAGVSWLGADALLRRVTEAFTARNDAGPTDVLAVTLPAGGSLAFAVPRSEAPAPSSRVREDVLSLVRRGKYHVREGGREAIVDFTTSVLRAAPADALVEERVPAETRKLAEAAARQGMSLADVAEAGTDGVVRRAGLGDSPEAREAAADLVDNVEQLIDQLTQGTVKTLGTKLTRADFGAADQQQKLAAAVGKELIPKMPTEVVVRAARETAEGRRGRG